MFKQEYMLKLIDNKIAKVGDYIIYMISISPVVDEIKNILHNTNYENRIDTNLCIINGEFVEYGDFITLRHDIDD